MIQDPEFSNHWTADEGKVLMKDDVYAKDIWLGIHDSIDNWTEGIPPEVIPADLTPEEIPTEIDKISIRMRILEEQSKQQWNSIASVETVEYATKNYNVGELMFVGSQLYKVIANIGNGNAIQEGVNVEATTVSDVIKLIANQN